MKSLLACLAVFASLALLLLQGSSSDAVTVCHDYSYLRAFGENKNNLGPAQLREALLKAGYKRFPFTTAADRDDADRSLRHGDVIILGEAHSGFVGPDGKVWHFLQLQGKIGHPYEPDMLPKHADLNRDGKMNKGGLFEGDNLKTFRSRGFMGGKGAVEIWRKPK